jgi:hypothetical protein
VSGREQIYTEDFPADEILQRHMAMSLTDPQAASSPQAVQQMEETMLKVENLDRHPHLYCKDMHIVGD